MNLKRFKHNLRIDYITKEMAVVNYFVIAIVFILYLQAPCFAKTLPEPKRMLHATYSIIEPFIDGQIAPEEWDDAYSIEKVLELYKTKGPGQFVIVERHPLKLYFKNNDEFLYIAVVLKDEDQDDSFNANTYEMSLDVFNIKFDNNGDGILQVGEDQRSVFLVNGISVYEDNHYISNNDKARGVKDKDLRLDGAAVLRFYPAKTKLNGHYVAEFKIPLSSGDYQDIDLKPGDVIKFNVFYIDKFNPSFTETLFGAFGPLELDSAYQWGYLKLASISEELPPGHISEGPSIFQETQIDSWLINGGFEEDGTPPLGWFLDVNAPGTAIQDKDFFRTGLASIRLTPNSKNKDFLSLSQPIDISSVKGKTVLVRGFICTQRLSGPAGLILFTPDQGTGMFTVPPDTQGAFVEVIGSWHVPENAKIFAVGCFVMGTTGNAWFDDISATLIF